MSDDNLRTALRELGDVPPPADLAGAALTRARRDRRRAITGLVAVIAILAAAAVTVPTVVLRRAAAPRTAVQPTVPITGFMVTAYTTVADPYNGTLPKSAPEVVTYPPAVYSPARHRYVTPPWRIAVPSPDGRLVAVSDAGPPPGPRKNVPAPSGPVGIVPADRVDDRTAVRWIAGLEIDHDWQLTWQADSRNLVLLVFPTTVGTFHLVDARTLATRTLTLPTDRPDDRMSLPVLTPDGRGFATVSDAVTGSGVTRWKLQYYDNRGQPTRDVLIVGTADLAHGAQPFSPDGRLVAMSQGDSTDIVDTSSGRIVRRAVDGLFAGWYDDERVIVAGGVAAADRLVRLVDVRTGRTVVQKVLAPPKRRLTGAMVAPVRGTPPPGAVVL